MAPKCNYAYLFAIDTQRRQGDSLTTEADIAVMRPQAKESLEFLETGRGQEQILSRALGRTAALQSLDFGFWPLEQ